MLEDYSKREGVAKKKATPKSPEKVMVKFLRSPSAMYGLAYGIGELAELPLSLAKQIEKSEYGVIVQGK